jgi:chemotaxis signal transduction protein
MHQQRQHVIFRLGEAEYALPVARVREIVRYEPVRSTSSQAPWVLGVFDVRGTVVQVIDIAGMLGIDAIGSGSEEAKVLLLDVAGTAAATGLLVDDVVEVKDLSDDDLDPAPPDAADTIAAIANIDGRLVLVLSASEVAHASSATGA